MERKMRMSKTMQWSHMRMTMARGRHAKTWLPDVFATLRDPKVPLKIKMYRARKWPSRVIHHGG